MMEAPAPLASRVSAARRQRFVGRAAELELFRSALAAPELPFYLLYVFGPGGVGKTTLLAEFAQICDQTQTPAVHLDGRHLQPSPQSFLRALRLAMDLEPVDSPLQALAERPCRQVLLVDTYETLMPLDGWLRETFLPQLPESTLVVLAGLQPPAPAWRADPGWQILLHALPLRNLSPEESRAYLVRREVPDEQHQAVLDFTHGHPLALSLVADVFAQRPGVHFQPESEPDVVRALLEQLVRKVPGPAHRAALEACALVRLTTEGLLAEMLGMPDAHELFDWLRRLSFVESGPRGLFPHDLAREALAADLRWRNPDWHAELHRRARGYYAARLHKTRGQEQQRGLFDYVFLHRDNPVVRPFFEWQESGSAVADSPREGEGPALVEMVASHEGQESAQLAEYWLAHQPEGVLVFRDAGQRPTGLLATVALHGLGPEELSLDPAARAAWDYLRTRAPLRPGEGASLFRFWMARDSYQAVSATQSLIFVNMIRHYLVTSGLAFTFLPCVEPDFWASVFAYAGLARIPEADFEVGGRRYGVYGHDWRAVPPMVWLEMLAARETASGRQVAPLRPPGPQPLVVLSEPEFEAAVRDALRDFRRPEALRESPLLRSRMVAERVGVSAGAPERVAALQRLIREAAESLRPSPRQEKCYQALCHTYLQPALTQERAAELLDLPFSTFRRHLKAGIALVTGILWQREIGAIER